MAIQRNLFRRDPLNVKSRGQQRAVGCVLVPPLHTVTCFLVGHVRCPTSEGPQYCLRLSLPAADGPPSKSLQSRAEVSEEALVERSITAHSE